ncbi:ATP synthase F1, delta subunit, partial [mine drainage metagenome]
DRWALAVSSAIGSDENAFDLWIRIFDLLLEFRNIRKARSFSLDGRVGLAEKVTLFRTALEEDLGSPLPENANRLLVPLVETNGWKVLPRLRESVIRTFDLRVGRVNVLITSPEPLSRDLQGKVLAALEHRVNEEDGGTVKTGLPGGPVRLSVRPEWKTRPA